MNNCPAKKLEEIEAVKFFIKNFGKQFDGSALIKEPEEPADIIYSDKGYQVVFADFGFQGKSHKAKVGEIVEMGSRSPEQIWRDFILNPILKKNKYGDSAKGLTLLINSAWIEPPWIEEMITNAKSLETNLSELKKLGFEEIYIIFPTRNLKLFP